MEQTILLSLADGGQRKGLVFFLEFSDGSKLKVDFGMYAYKSLEPYIIYRNINTDSLFDIGVNKLSTIGNRLEVKDFTDLYFILKKYTVWDLFRG